MLTMKHITAYILFVALTFSPVAWAQTQVANGRIAFASKVDGDFEIYTVNPDGSDLRQLSSNSARDIKPKWSPDGLRIAFTSDRDNTDFLQIYVMNADGSNSVNLTGDVGGYTPTWSPTGDKIAFVAETDGPFDIFVMNDDGAGRINLTQNPQAYDTSPAWSPDGSQIAFLSTRAYGLVNAVDSFQPYDLYVMNADGTNQRLLLAVGRDMNYLDWSPDGSRILFATYGSMTSDQIWTVTSDGQNLTDITAVGAGLGGDPSWSPDGQKIVFVSDSGITTMDADGHNLMAVLDPGDYGWHPSWQPIFPPMADAGPDQTVAATNGVDALVTLDGSGSANANTYIWTVQGSNYPGTDPLRQFTLPIGVHPVTLQACDANYTNCDEDEAIMTVLAPISSTGTGLRGQYFDNSNLIAPKFFRAQHGGLSSHYSANWE